MAPVRLDQNRTVAARPPYPSGPIFALFDDVDDTYYCLPRTRSIVARVVVKFPVEPRYRDKQHYILEDITGSKIEAIAYQENALRFDALLHQGCTYTMHGVSFNPNPGNTNFRNIGRNTGLALGRHTTVEPFTMPIQFPPYPKHLMPFHEVIQQYNKTFVDIIGIVLHMAPLEHIGGRQYRETESNDRGSMV